jgi:hypothetical protein
LCKAQFQENFQTIKHNVRFEVFTAVTMKNGVFWDVTQCGTLFAKSVRRFLVTASVVPSSPILVTLMKETLSSSETSVLAKATRRNNPEDTILQPNNLLLLIHGDKYCDGHLVILLCYVLILNV